MSNMLEAPAPQHRRASLISEIYSETHTLANVPGRKPKESKKPRNASTGQIFHQCETEASSGGGGNTLLEVKEPPQLRRASLISEIYSETHTLSNVPGRNKPKFTSITSAGDYDDGNKKKRNWMSRMEKNIWTGALVKVSEKSQGTKYVHCGYVA